MADLEQRLAQLTPLQRAVLALKETQQRLEAFERQRDEPIALVGMSCRFPGGANDTESFWRMLCDGVNAIREIPAERWDVDAFYDPDPAAPGKMNTRWGGFVEKIDEFDNHFFSISDREATRIDPQHRLSLELTWEALENAGIPPSSLRGSLTGVFIGLSHSEYGMMLSTDMAQSDAYVGTGTAHCLAANRISFVYDFHGPSVMLDTACSSSLVAVHLACQAIRSGDAELAVAGGVNIILSPLATVNLTKAGFYLRRRPGPSVRCGRLGIRSQRRGGPCGSQAAVRGAPRPRSDLCVDPRFGRQSERLQQRAHRPQSPGSGKRLTASLCGGQALTGAGAVRRGTRHGHSTG